MTRQSLCQHSAKGLVVNSPKEQGKSLLPLFSVFCPVRCPRSCGCCWSSPADSRAGPSCQRPWGRCPREVVGAARPEPCLDAGPSLGVHGGCPLPQPGSVCMCVASSPLAPSGFLSTGEERGLTVSSEWRGLRPASGLPVRPVSPQACPKASRQPPRARHHYSWCPETPVFLGLCSWGFISPKLMLPWEGPLLSPRKPTGLRKGLSAQGTAGRVARGGQALTAHHTERQLPDV